MSEAGVFKKTRVQAEQIRVIGGKAQHILSVGGSRSGKTFGFTRALVIRAVKAPKSRHVIWRYRLNHLMASIWSDTFPKVMRICFPNVPYETNKVEGVIRLPNDSEIWMGGLDDKDRVEKILGQEFATVYLNEISQITYDSVTTGLSRLAQRNENLKLKAFYDCNPPSKKHWSYKLWFEGVDPETGRPIDKDQYDHLFMNPADNVDNLAPEYLKMLESLPARKRKRFLEGRYGDDNENALWNYGVFIHAAEGEVVNINRIVVAVDPAVSSTPGADEHGIIVCARDDEDRGYVLADYSCTGKPHEWAAQVAKAYREFNADAVVAEVNQGGDMVESTVRQVLPNAAVIQVRATRGKGIRAEPISALYAQGRVTHVGDLETLEEQMCDMTIDFDRKAAGYSPDRVDALVWGMTELFLEEEGGAFFMGKF